jgi:hypothetical protein
MPSTRSSREPAIARPVEFVVTIRAKHQQGCLCRSPTDPIVAVGLVV